MTHASCHHCRLRFTPATAAYLPACPECGAPLAHIAGLEGIVGFRLFEPKDPAYSLPEAAAASMPIPDPDTVRYE